MFPITYKSDPGDGVGATFKVHTKKEVAYFKPCMKGLHNIYLKHHKTLYVQTMQGNFEGFTKEQVMQAIKARKLQAMMGSPARAIFKGMVHHKLIDNCPADVAHLHNAHIICGLGMAGLKGRTVWRRPEKVVTNIVATLRDFMRLHKFVILTTDIMFVNSAPFLFT